MRGNRNVIGGHEMVGTPLDLEAVKEWAKRTFSKQMVDEATARLLVLGYMGAVIQQVSQTY